MIKLGENEKVDWFRITTDLINCGISISALSRISGIPVTTINTWRQKLHRPKLEEAFKLINIWAEYTGKSLNHIPIYNCCLPDAHPSQPKF